MIDFRRYLQKRNHRLEIAKPGFLVSSVSFKTKMNYYLLFKGLSEVKFIFKRMESILTQPLFQLLPNYNSYNYLIYNALMK